MSTRCVALLRGINVGKAKRITMANLRAIVESLGHRDVATLLNSGNVVFTLGATKSDPAGRIERAITEVLGVTSRVTVLTASEIATIVEENPFAKVANDPARYLVIALRTPEAKARLEPLARQDWSPGRLALGPRWAYLWCADGLLESRVAQVVQKTLGEDGTGRNWATIHKLHALASTDG